MQNLRKERKIHRVYYAILAYRLRQSSETYLKAVLIIEPNTWVRRRTNRIDLYFVL